MTESSGITKVLVANRGEIAVRIMQTCAEMGIGTVAVYSTADADSLHVQRADEAYCIGAPPAHESYLNIGSILDAARQSGADAIHPGYGFLAENPRFAREVVDAGLTWIGPPPDVIAHLGDKVASKKLAESAGVPTLPGYSGDDLSDSRILIEAERIGYPLMLKAAAGGGGRGMRVVDSPQGLSGALQGARREAQSAFGDDRVFLEKLLVNPRHIEIQIMLDSHRNGVHLGERECSIQRRHQKVMEESPSPVLTQQLRTQMGAAALRLARAAGYVNAGTVEFLFAGDDFYFLEVNTRIQVEHPVTELVTGLDIVRMQIEIAAGKPLSVSQLDIRARGHAIEARLYAEDPANGFLPATGRLELFDPSTGPGIRNDVGVFPGAEVSRYYDPILGKLVVHAGTRRETVRRLRSALERYVVLGATCNLSFLHWMTEQADFEAGKMDTGYVDRNWHPSAGTELPVKVLMAAAAYEQLSSAQALDGCVPPSPWRQPGGWRAGGIGQVYSYSYGGRTAGVKTTRASPNSWIMTTDGETRTVEARWGGPGVVVVRDGSGVKTFACSRQGEGLAVSWKGTTYLLLHPELQVSRGRGGKVGQLSPVAPMPGTVVKVEVEAGQRVSAHEPLLVMEAMKIEHVIEAPHDGIVTRVLFKEGDLVPAGSPVVELEEA